MTAVTKKAGFNQSITNKHTHKPTKENFIQVAHPVYRLAAAVADAYSHEAASHGFRKERHMTPALQLVSRQTDTIQLFGE